MSGGMEQFLAQTDPKHSHFLPGRRQSDVLQAEGKVLTPQLGSSPAAGEDLPDGRAGVPGAAMTNPGLVTSGLGYLERRCSYGAHRDLRSAPFSIQNPNRAEVGKGGRTTTSPS